MTNIILDPRGFIGKRNIKTNTASRLILKILNWYEKFEMLIIDDRNITIEGIYIRKADSDPFSTRVTVTIKGTAYGVPVEEMVYFHLADIFSPKKPKVNFGQYLTERFAEKLKSIKWSVDDQSKTIDETMTKLGQK